MSKRGRPKGKLSSRISLLLLLLLRESPAESSTLGYLLGIPSKTIAVYMGNLKRAGYVKREGLFWSLTDQGYALLAKLESSINSLSKIVNSLSIIHDKFLTKEIRKNSKEIRKNSKEITNHDKTLLGLEPVIRALSGAENKDLNSIISIIEKRLKKELTETQYIIIKWLYEKTKLLKRKYIIPPRPCSIAELISEETGIPVSMIGEALRELEAQGIVFMTYDKRRGVPKIRLDRSII